MLGNGSTHDAPAERPSDGRWRRGPSALAAMLRLRQQRLRLGFERVLLRSSLTVALAIALGALASAGAIVLALGVALWLATAAGWPAWTWLLLAGVVLLLAAAVAARLLRPGTRSEPTDASTEEDGVAAAAHRDLADSLAEGCRLFASPLGLLLAFGGGFAALRAFRNRPRLVRTLLGPAMLGRLMRT